MSSGIDICAWRKSSHSGGDGNCLEAASLAPQIGVRDSKDAALGHLALSAASWSEFLASLKVC